MVLDGKTRRRMNQREWECFEDGVNYERDRIIKLLEEWGTLKITPYCEIPIWLAKELIRGESND
jgi:hypothetical protein